MNHKPWDSIFETYKINEHDFSKSPFYITAKDIKQITMKAGFSTTNETEARVLAKQDSREDRPQVFIDNNLFILPIKNGIYAIIQGEGYINIPEIHTKIEVYNSKLDFELETSLIGNSEMQHLDFAYAEFEIFYKVFPMKDYAKQIPARHSAKPNDLAKTQWFKQKIEEVLNS